MKMVMEQRNEMESNPQIQAYSSKAGIPEHQKQPGEKQEKPNKTQRKARDKGQGEETAAGASATKP